MAESKVSKSAATKKKTKKVVEDAEKRRERKRMAPTSRRWVPPVFIAVGLLGGLWLVTYYIAGNQIPFMSELGDWNVLIGMGLMAAAFAISTLWK
ncbi:cell division protein CrgA [Tessaracoccus sp. SD287]|uniref:cell division protein CrgA n=1 Tax=Tessaracoccus sp. SD287 TaxID=2782008 RepID=UPI001A967DFF|nr:cell division protein CrgA [Tessaracoccus sp. SD287]MBO1030628.1 cell division protein CrgA [Tessaracoccus sp. SD287]